MKLFKPVVNLVRQPNIGSPDDFFIHAITFTDTTAYRACGFSLTPNPVDSEAILQIELFIREEEDLPNLGYLTPVVHTFNFNTEEGFIKIILINEDLPEENRKIGDVVSGTADADIDTKPILDYS